MAQISAEGVWKRFTLHKDRADSVGQLLVRMIPGRGHPPSTPFWALRDVSFQMTQGESLGIIGNNGSGKSTLLKLLTRTMLPTKGRVSVEGRTSALIELGAGFHPDFTGRENVILSASILGIGRREIMRRMDEVISFAEIAEFIDVPVKYYSSGMQARLGFAVAINVEPEILIVDEVLGVGDEAFQRKCMDRILTMKRSGISILLVSHDLKSVENLMNRAMWLDHGAVAASGQPSAVIAAYRRANGVAQPETPVSRLEGDVLLRTSECTVSGAVRTRQRAEVRLIFENEAVTPIRGYANLVVRRGDGLQVAEVSGYRDGSVLELQPGRRVITLEFEQVYLVAGTYVIDVALTDEQGARIGYWPSAVSFRVQSDGTPAGVVDLPHRWLV